MPSLQVFIYIDKILLDPSLLQAEQYQFSQPSYERFFMPLITFTSLECEIWVLRTDMQLLKKQDSGAVQ